MERLNAKSSVVILILHRKQRPAFDPAMSHSSILGKAVGVVGRAQEFVGAPNVVPLLARKGQVTTLHRVVIHGDDQKWRCIGGNVRVGIILEQGTSPALCEISCGTFPSC